MPWLAQEAPQASDLPAAAPAAAPAERSWSGGFETYLYLPEDDHFLLPILRPIGERSTSRAGTSTRTGTPLSVAGLDAGGGEKLHLEVVPMAGGVFGRTNGLAPGLELTLAWKSLELYGESEYLFDLESKEGNYFYNWSELSWHARPWLTLGLSAQRTRLYQSELTIDRGIVRRRKRAPFTLKAYGFNGLARQ